MNPINDPGVSNLTAPMKFDYKVSKPENAKFGNLTLAAGLDPFCEESKAAFNPEKIAVQTYCNQYYFSVYFKNSEKYLCRWELPASNTLNEDNTVVVNVKLPDVPMQEVTDASRAWSVPESKLNPLRSGKLQFEGGTAVETEKLKKLFDLWSYLSPKTLSKAGFGTTTLKMKISDNSVCTQMGAPAA